MNISLLAPKDAQIDEIWNKKNEFVFSDYSKNFIASFSDILIKDKRVQSFPELIALAFWMRKANLSIIQDKFFSERKNRIFFARGTVFHVAPSNVDSIFIYSMILSMIMGNKNIVRVSRNTNSTQFQLIINILNTLFLKDEWSEIASKNYILSYEYDNNINKYFSSKADVRVVWGGDKTIEKFRKYPLNPNAMELCFANKRSICLLNSKEINRLKEQELQKLVKLFCNDTYWFNQMACSSPRLVAWYGNYKDISISNSVFWPALSKELSNRNQIFEVSTSINKSLAADRSVIEGENIKVDNSDPRITRVKLDNAKYPLDTNCGGGFFFEISVDHLSKLSSFLNRDLQTITYFGFNNKQLRNFLYETSPRGVDRIVPIGKALEFNNIWDGIDMLSALSREIFLQ